MNYCCNDLNRTHALHWICEGRHSNALQPFASTGVAFHDDDSANQDLLKRHPTSPCPDSNDSISVTVDDSMVLSSLKGFPKSTSPNFVLMDAVSGSFTTRAAADVYVFWCVS